MSFTLGPAILFCPADRSDRYQKAAERSDAVILDLEDAVAPSERPAARTAVAQYLAELSTEDRARTVVRINPVGTEDFTADIAALSNSQPRFVMLAKAQSGEDIQAVHNTLPDAQVLALCETAAGAANVPQIAAHPATVAIMWGAEDLIVSIGGTSSRKADGSYRDIARHVRSTVLLAASAQGIAAIDAIYADITDSTGLAEEAADAVGSGFAAKACIHPAQVDIIRQAYQPTEDELDYARALLAEVPTHGGAFQFRGSMIDGPLIRHAELIAQRGERLN